MKIGKKSKGYLMAGIVGLTTYLVIIPVSQEICYFQWHYAKSDGAGYTGFFAGIMMGMFSIFCAIFSMIDGRKKIQTLWKRVTWFSLQFCNRITRISLQYLVSIVNGTKNNVRS